MPIGGDEGMTIKIRAYHRQDIAEAIQIWNEVVEEGIAFPQMERLTASSGHQFFTEQSFTGIAYEEAGHKIVGLYTFIPITWGAVVI